MVTKTFPTCWKLSLIHPIPKKGDKSDPSNYRPISLTSILAKVFESLLNSHFLSHLESLHLLSDHQYGFRKARSTGDILAYLSDIWLSHLKKRGETCVVALDISKAFDRVWHAALIAKLPAFGFPPSLCTFISSYLSNRSISAVVDGARSKVFNTNSGVPQGAVLSPTLFLLFINDLFSSPINPVHAYADDSTLHASESFKSAPSNEDRAESRLRISQSISDDLVKVSQWGADNLVKFNTSKTQLFSVSRARSSPDFNVEFGADTLDLSDSVNILGLTFNSSMSWFSHISNLARSASKKISALFKVRQYFTDEQLLAIYKGYIRPCIEYCSHVWGGSSATRLLERVELRAMRLINSAHLRNSLDSLSLRRTVGALTIFYRYYHGYCADELAARMPPPVRQTGHRTRGATASHDWTVEISNQRIACYDTSFFPAVSRLWNSLPSHIFPRSLNFSKLDLQAFKCSVCTYLRGLPIECNTGWGFLILP
jgi:hypothetical protein